MSSNYPLSSLRALTQYAKDAETSQSDALREYMYAMLLVTEFSVLQMKAAVRGKKTADTGLWTILAEMLTRMAIFIHEGDRRREVSRKSCARSIAIAATESIGVRLIESAETRRNLSFEEIVGEERWTLMISPSTS